MDATPLMYTVAEFRKLARISESAFWRLQQRGEAPKVIRIGARTYVSPEAASRWVREREALSQAVVAQ